MQSKHLIHRGYLATAVSRQWFAISEPSDWHVTGDLGDLTGEGRWLTLYYSLFLQLLHKLDWFFCKENG